MYFIILGVPLTDASYFATMTKEQFAAAFRSDSEFDIPMIEDRYDVITTAGKVLLQKYDGKFSNVLKKCDKSAQTLLKIITEDFKSYK